MKKICVVTLNIEFDDKHTNPKDWQWDDLINQPISNLPPIEFERYYCSTQLVNCQYFDSYKQPVDNL